MNRFLSGLLFDDCFMKIEPKNHAENLKGFCATRGGFVFVIFLFSFYLIGRNILKFCATLVMVIFWERNTIINIKSHKLKHIYHKNIKITKKKKNKKPALFA